jgi:hypothetical protein
MPNRIEADFRSPQIISGVAAISYAPVQRPACPSGHWGYLNDVVAMPSCLITTTSEGPNSVITNDQISKIP